MYLIIIDFIQKKYQPFPSIPYNKEIEDFVVLNLNRMNEKLDSMLDYKSDVEFDQLGVLNADNFELEQNLYDKNAIKFNNLIDLGEEPMQLLSNILPEISVKLTKEDDFSKLNLDQQRECLKTLSSENKNKLIKKYFKIIIRNIFKDFLCHWGNIPKIIEEINYLQDSSGNRFPKFTDEFICTFNYFSEIGKGDAVKRIEILKFINELVGEGDSLTFLLAIEDVTYHFTSKNTLEPKIFTLLKHISSNILRSAIEEGEFKTKPNCSISRVLYQKKIFAFSTGKKFSTHRRLRVNVKKEAVLIIELLEPFCEKFTPFILKINSKETIYASNFSNEYLRLAKAYFTIKEFKKAMYWVDEFLMIIEKVDCQLNFHIYPDFTALKSKYILEQNKYKSFEDARVFARALNLKSENGWREYKKLGLKPSDIPAKPENVYKDKGWSGFRDWLGYTNSKSNQFKEYEHARAFVRTLGLKSEKEWREYKMTGNKPNNIPAKPENTYIGKGWSGFRDWLGTSNLKKEFRSFEEAKEFVKTLDVKSDSEWRIYCQSGKKPNDIPSSPHITYKLKGWSGTRDFLGIGEPYIKKEKVQILDFQKAKSFAQNLNLNSSREWNAYCTSGNKPSNIPSSPAKVYKDKGWSGFGDWLGYTAINKFNFLEFEDARKFVRGLNLKSENDWREYKRSGLKPSDIPAKPENVYKDKGWSGFRDWLRPI